MNLPTEEPTGGDIVLRSIRWLADMLRRHDSALTAGQIILTGSLMRLIPVSAESQIRGDAGRWGAVEDLGRGR